MRKYSEIVWLLRITIQVNADMTRQLPQDFRIVTGAQHHALKGCGRLRTASVLSQSCNAASPRSTPHVNLQVNRLYVGLEPCMLDLMGS
jgi:hypothetical protein